MKQQGPQACEEQRGAHLKARQRGNQDCGPEHGKHVLDPQDQHFGRPQGLRVIDSFSSDLLFRLHCIPP